MARASTINDSKIRLLLIAPSKVGKTFWTCQAAEAGFNLVYLDGDIAIQTINSLDDNGKPNFSDEAKNRIYHFDMGDGLDGPQFSKMVKHLFDAKDSRPFLWDDAHSKRVILGSDSTDDIPISHIDLRKMTMNDVLVIDSLTSLSYSAKDEVAVRCGDDLGEMEKADRGVYASSGNRLTKFLVILKNLPCHVVVIAHPDEYTQEGKPTVQIPMSSSRPHGNTLGKYFTDILWMSVSVSGKRELDGRPDPRRIVGSRFGNKKTSDIYSFAELVKAAGAPPPNPSAEFQAVKEYAPGTYTPPESVTLARKKVIGKDSKSESGKVLGLAGLAKAKGKK